VSDGGCLLVCLPACLGCLLAWLGSLHLPLQASSRAYGCAYLPARCGCLIRNYPAPLSCRPCAGLSPRGVGGYYRPGTYLLAKLVLDALLLRVIPACIFTAPFYPMVSELLFYLYF
jgi:hypothetical protein